MVAAVVPTVAAVAVQPDGGAPAAGPACSDWMTNEFDVSLSTSPPEMATVPVGQLAVAVAGMIGRRPDGESDRWCRDDLGAERLPGHRSGCEVGSGDRAGAQRRTGHRPRGERGLRHGPGRELARADRALRELGSDHRIRRESRRVDRARGDLLAAHRPVGEGAAVQHASGQRRTARREHERDKCDDGCRTGRARMRVSCMVHPPLRSAGSAWACDVTGDRAGGAVIDDRAVAGRAREVDRRQQRHDGRRSEERRRELCEEARRAAGSGRIERSVRDQRKVLVPCVLSDAAPQRWPRFRSHRRVDCFPRVCGRRRDSSARPRTSRRPPAGRRDIASAALRSPTGCRSCRSR